MNNLRKHGFEWKNTEEFLSLFFGEGMFILINGGVKHGHFQSLKSWNYEV